MFIPLRPPFLMPMVLLLAMTVACSGDPSPTPEHPTATPSTPTPDTPTAPSPTPEPVCGDGRLAPAEGCDDGGIQQGDGCSPECTVEYFYACEGAPSVCELVPAICGDGLIHPDEDCDDKNNEAGDGCADNCEVERLYACEGQPSRCSILPAVCGDGLIHPDEACDDKNPIGGDGCSAACVVEDFYSCAGEPSRCELVPSDCGDGEVHPLEQCDQGAANSDDIADSCRTDCTLPSCGDGVLDAGEVCDDGPLNSATAPGACRLDCKPARCGDGVVEQGELCDEGPGNSNFDADACRTDCGPARCGDAVVDEGESCDAGPNNSDVIPNACRTSCVEAACGDAILDSGEQCDKGEENSNSAPDTCRTTCELARCGDGIVDSGEECDAGAANGDGVLGACNTSCQVQLEYERMITLSSTGAVIFGGWDPLLNRLWNEAADCRARFDGRISKIEHVERTAGGLLLDFQGLHAWDRNYDSYAYLSLEPGVRAGLGTSQRYSAPEVVILKDREQFEEVSFLPMTVDVFCSRRNPYVHLAQFDAQGLAVSGDFDEVFEWAVDRAADCKVKVDDRLFATPHVDYDTYLLNFDVIGLGDARRPSLDTFAFAQISSGNRAGLGASSRQGDINSVHKRDRDVTAALAFAPGLVDVYCADKYEPMLTMVQAGAVIEGQPFSELISAVSVEGKRCKARFDNRVVTPARTEYSASRLRMDLMNLHAWNDGADAMAFVDLNVDVRAGVGTVYRRGLDTAIYKPSLEQWPEGGQKAFDYTVEVLCEADVGWISAYSMSSNGADLYGRWSDIYRQVTEDLVECRLQVPGIVGEPVLVEYTAGSLLFDYHGLAAYAAGREAYATHVLTQLSVSGVAGSYRDGDANDVGKKDRLQAALSAVQPTDVQLRCR